VARDLPEKVEQTLFCQLEPAATGRCTTNCAIITGKQSSIASSRMAWKNPDTYPGSAPPAAPAAIHPGLIDRARILEPSAKLDMLLPQLAEVLEEGHKALIFFAVHFDAQHPAQPAG